MRIAEVLCRDPPKPRIKKDGKWVVEVESKTLYELLGKPLKLKRLRPFIEYSDECMGAFLRGFFDSEGSISKRGQIRVYNTDYRLLCYVRRTLLRFGIKTTQRQPKIDNPAGKPSKDPRTGKPIKRKKHEYYLIVSKLFNDRFYEKVGFMIERKRQRLEDYLRRRRQPTIPSIYPFNIIEFLQPVIEHHTENHILINHGPAGI